jgi:hypothetical protein
VTARENPQEENIRLFHSLSTSTTIIKNGLH